MLRAVSASGERIGYVAFSVILDGVLKRPNSSFKFVIRESSGADNRSLN
jgi:hypothetical protein